MKPEISAFARSYRSALKKHLNDRAARASLPYALGTHAVGIGISADELVRIHEDVLPKVFREAGSDAEQRNQRRRADSFLTGATKPLEDWLHGSRTTPKQLRRITQLLRGRTGEVAVLNRKLESEIAGRESAERSLKASERRSSRRLETSQRARAEMRLLSRRLLSVQEEERKRISRELHDVVAQTLSGIHLRLANLFPKSGVEPKDLRAQITNTQRLIEKSVEVVHDFARDLRPSLLDNLGLIPALQSYLVVLRKQSGMAIELKTTPGMELLDDDSKTAFFRIVQESLSNAARHANARHIAVNFWLRSGKICLEVADDGQGFDVRKLAGTGHGKHLGVLGMKERAEMVGGAFVIQSAPGTGTKVRVKIPRLRVHELQTESIDSAQ